MTICERMFFIMDEKGLKAAQLCRILGIKTSQTSMWKKQNTDPPAKYLAQICEFLGVSIEFLVTGNEQVSNDSGAMLSERERWFIDNLRALDEERLFSVQKYLLEVREAMELEKGTGASA